MEERERDALGRVTALHGGLGTTTYTYNNKSELTYQKRVGLGEGTIYRTINEIWFDYQMETTPGNFNGAYLGGLVTHVRTNNYQVYKSNGAYYNDGDPETATRYTYVWWDGGVRSNEKVDTNTASTGDPLIESDYFYDVNGYLGRVEVDDGLPRTITYRYDVRGQVIERFDNMTTSDVSDIRDHHYYLDGRVMGNLSYWGAEAPVGHFELAFADIYAPGGDGLAQTSSRYVVRSGDSLQSIAERLWGDGSLWWMIAEANGMTSATQLAAGMSPTNPNKVHNQHHNAYTFKPYDPNKATGDTSPRVAKPIPAPKDKGCGAAQIFIAIIAVVVTVATFGAGAMAMTGASTLGSAMTSLTFAQGAMLGAAAGAAGSIVSQGVAVATGVQDRFSMKAVGLAMLSGAVSGGLTGGLGPATSAVGMAGRAVLGNVITQGLAVATGLQDRFDWVGVAVAGIVGGVGGWAGGKLAQAAPFVRDVISGLAGGVAGAAARSLLTGTDFGDNFMAVLPDVVGTTVGNMIARGAESGRTTPALIGADTTPVEAATFDQNPELIPLPAVDIEPVTLNDFPRASPPTDGNWGRTELDSDSLINIRGGPPIPPAQRPPYGPGTVRSRPQPQRIPPERLGIPNGNSSLNDLDDVVDFLLGRARANIDRGQYAILNDIKRMEDLGYSKHEEIWAMGTFTPNGPELSHYSVVVFNDPDKTAFFYGSANGYGQEIVIESRVHENVRIYSTGNQVWSLNPPKLYSAK